MTSSRAAGSALLLLSASLARGARGQEPETPPETGAAWTMVHEVEGIKVFQRVSANPALKEFKAIGTLDIPASVLSGVLKDRKKYTEFFPYLIENQPIQKSGSLQLQRALDAPAVSVRDYTVELFGKDLEDGPGSAEPTRTTQGHRPCRTTSGCRSFAACGRWSPRGRGRARSPTTSTPIPADRSRTSSSTWRTRRVCPGPWSRWGSRAILAEGRRTAQ
ncbi:MAG: hypothetical protein U0166_23845 [Acidobacteriota bacterium]